MPEKLLFVSHKHCRTCLTILVDLGNTNNLPHKELFVSHKLCWTCPKIFIDLMNIISLPKKTFCVPQVLSDVSQNFHRYKKHHPYA